MSMDWALVFVLQVIIQPSLSVFVTVEAEQTKYTSEFEGDVVMKCKFQPVRSDTLTDLRVYWHRIMSNGKDRPVYMMGNVKENSSSQDTDFQGRVKLNTEKLQKGLAELQVSRLRISDSGNYKCLVMTRDGADYKKMSLSVTAPYKAVTKHIQEVAEGDEVLLTCQSEGYPESPVAWQDGHLRNLNANTTSVSTPDQLFIVTSQIKVRSSDKNSYTCNFTNDGYSATFHIPDDIPLHYVKNDALIVALSIGMILVVIVVAVLTYKRRKGSSTHSTRNLLVNGQDRSISAAACLQRMKENEEEITNIKDDYVEENLGVSLKTHYSDFSFSMEVERYWDLPQRLQNNEGQPVALQALIPEAREMLFLEGPPGSGKTTIAHVLISSWAKGPTDALSNLLDLSMLRLLIYVDCSTVKADLFQEIISQLSLENLSTEDELRTALTKSSNALLLLDGYKEGNQFFDESLKRFLCEREGCRVLVMACPGQVPTLRATVGTGELLKLQIQTVKY